MSNFIYGSSILEGDNTTPGCQLTEKEKKCFLETLQICRDYGLDFYPTIIQKLRYDEMSEVAAYDGFPNRFPHWYWGMQYEELQRGYEHNQHRIYELVVNTNPCVIYILASNTLVDNVCVVAHATGHNDFFKNNIHFMPTDQNMMNKLANNGARIRKYMNRWGREKVTEFIDHVLRIQTLIDPSKAWQERAIKDPVVRDHREYEFPRTMKVDKDRLHMYPWLNPDEYLQEEYERIKKLEAARELDIFKNPDKDVFGFIKDYAPLKPWQEDIIAMLYEESMYFAPQRMTKTINEGFACGRFDTLVLTDKGYLPLGHIVDNKLKLKVHDGSQFQNVINWFKFDDRGCLKITTKRGFVFEGAATHKLLNNNLEWTQLQDLDIGDKIQLSHNNRAWSGQKRRLFYKPKQFTKSLVKISKEHDISRDRLYNILRYSRFADLSQNLVDDLKVYQEEKRQLEIDDNYNRRKAIKIPEVMDEDFAAFCGYMTGDGHIANNRAFGFTSADEELVDHYVNLVRNLFGLECRKKWDDSSKNGRWRVHVCSKHVENLLVKIGYEKGVCARDKTIPQIILKSPKSVIASYLKTYFDCDGHAGKSGIILSTSSEKMAEQIQVVLLNFGIISNRFKKAKGNFHIYVGGASAKIFSTEIGFGLTRKQKYLKNYISKKDMNNSRNDWTDEIASIEKLGTDTVYDITVENTYRYVAQGFINHNSFIDYEIMTRQGHVALGQDTHDAGIFQYAIHKMGVLGGKYSMNPYKLGFYLLLNVEERWNKGRFGTEWEECKDLKKKEDWDLKLGLGKEKVFEVRKYYDDVTLINEFFTQEFCDEFEFFEWKKYPNGEYRIESRDHKVIKKKLLQSRLNGGLPDIRVADPNHRNRGWLLLQHYWDGRLLYEPYTRDVLTSLYYFWKKEVVLATRDMDDIEGVFVCTGTDPDKDIALVPREEYEEKW